MVTMLMMLRVTLITTLLLVPVVGLTFFGTFEQIEQQLNKLEGKSGGELQDILLQLEQTQGGGFADVSSEAWFYSYVSSVARWGIVSGYRDNLGNSTGKFGPGDSVTVAQILKMALRAAGVDETTCQKSPLHPQANTHWAKAFVACAEAGNFRLINNSVDLERPAKRAEVLTVVHDAFDDQVPPLFSSFTDVINHPLEADIAYAAALGIVAGDTDVNGNATGTFRPNALVNRAEAAKIIYGKLRVEVMGE